ncbi:MAG TPA: hypothetical protein VIK77_00405 [Tissierellaceae bacterium]
MLLTNTHLDLVKENRRDFQLKRIKWAIRELRSQGEIPKLRDVLRKAGIRKKFCKNIENFF